MKKSLLCLLIVHTICVVGMDKQKKEAVVDRKQKDTKVSVGTSKDKQNGSKTHQIGVQEYLEWHSFNTEWQKRTTGISSR